VGKVHAPHGSSGEAGWLPDCVYTGEKFEFGVAFFADTMGRISRFSREPADLAAAWRLAGQAALPGLVNAHSHAFHRVLRGRTESRGRTDRDALAGWREVHDAAAAKLAAEDIYETARMAFLEMLLSGITCVGEFHYLHQQPDGSPWPDPNFASREILRAAREMGVRIALLPSAWTRADFKAAGGSAPARFRASSVDQFVREVETLRVSVEADFPDDEVWLGLAPHSLAAVSLDECKALSAYAHSKRMRLHMHVATRAEEVAACAAEYGRPPIALLAEHGLVDKRFTAVGAIHLTDDEVKLLGTARASVCACPSSEAQLGCGIAPVEKLVAAGAGLALGTDSQIQSDLLQEARLLDYELRSSRRQRTGLAAEAAKALFHAATFAGARSLGATTGALEVGRPADFFTVNLYDPALAGADADSLLANIVFSGERRAVRDVWIGARQRLAGGRHVNQGPMVGKFVELQKRVWSG
jgi:formimidoylglutamate deiminase